MRIWLALAAAAFFGLSTSPALAERDPRSGAPFPPKKKRETPSPITDHFYVRGIYFPPHVRTNIRVDPRGAPGTGTLINAERDVGLPSRLNMGRMELMFRLRERNRLRVDFLEVDRSASHRLAKTIVFGDQTFNATEVANTSIDWRIFGLTYTYSIFRNDHVEVGTGLGLYLLEAQAHGEVPARLQRQDVSGAGPFPTIPLDVTWRISTRFALTARAQYFRAALNNFDGWMADIHEDVQYRWKPNFALGVGWTTLRASLNLNTGSFPGGFKLDTRGPEAFFRVSF